MACCGSSRPSTKYRVTAPDGSVHVYLTQPEASIALATFGGGSMQPITDDETK